MVHLTTALEPGSGVPLYEQLYRSLAGEMRTGALPAGTRMPGKRRLAAELSVSVNTVDTAYQMLAAEGYLAGRAGCTGPVARPGRAGARRAGTAGAVRPVHPGRGPGAVSLPHLGAAAEGTAVLLPGAADQRRRPG